MRRISVEAGHVIAAAGHEAAALGASEAGAEHLLLALLGSEDRVVRECLATLVTREQVMAWIEGANPDVHFDADDAEALSTLGIDLPRLLGKLEEAFGSEALSGPSPRRPGPPRRSVARLGSAVSAAVEAALFEGLADRNGQIEPAQLLLGLLRSAAEPAATMFAALGLDYESVRRCLLAGGGSATAS